MSLYGIRQLADSMRAVRQNTILIAGDIPESKYGFRATPETRSVAETLVHIAWLSDAILSERVLLPGGGSVTRFEMLVGTKEHELQHRAQPAFQLGAHQRMRIGAADDERAGGADVDAFEKDDEGHTLSRCAGVSPLGPAEGSIRPPRDADPDPESSRRNLRRRSPVLP